jgi:membrane protease YdiL (CAAX protease family)
MRAGGVFELRPTWGGRAKALGLVVLYILFVAALAGAGIVVMAAAGLGHMAKAHTITLPELLLGEAVLALCAVGAAVLCGLLVRQPPSRYGFPARGALSDFVVGIVTGLVLMAGLLGAMSAMGGFDFGTVALARDRILGYAAFYALLFLLVGVLEETAFRSFALVQLSRAIGFWPAAIILAALFGLAHMTSINENPLGLVLAGLAGLVLSYSFWRTGALWFAIGFHAAWDYAESFIFGVPDSGHSAVGVLMQPSFHGPVWLTGGTVGPEGSVLAFAALLVLAAFIRFALPRREA